MRSPNTSGERWARGNRTPAAVLAGLALVSLNYLTGCDVEKEAVPYTPELQAGLRQKLEPEATRLAKRIIKADKVPVINEQTNQFIYDTTRKQGDSTYHAITVITKNPAQKTGPGTVEMVQLSESVPDPYGDKKSEMVIARSVQFSNKGFMGNKNESWLALRLIGLPPKYDFRNNDTKETMTDRPDDPAEQARVLKIADELIKSAQEDFEPHIFDPPQADIRSEIVKTSR
jgi:hypothetical protein